MQPFQSFAAGVLANVLRRQPPSPARDAFAWSVAVGPALARVTSVQIDGGVVRVTARDARWGREIERARDTILDRLRLLLGADAAVRLVVDASMPPARL